MKREVGVGEGLGQCCPASSVREGSLNMCTPDALGKRVTSTFGPAVDLRGDKMPGAAWAA